jgi:hypothetical protein
MNIERTILKNQIEDLIEILEFVAFSDAFPNTTCNIDGPPRGLCVAEMLNQSHPVSQMVGAVVGAPVDLCESCCSPRVPKVGIDIMPVII